MSKLQYGNPGKQDSHLEFWKTIWTAPPTLLSPPPPVPQRTIQVPPYQQRRRRYNVETYEELEQYAKHLAGALVNEHLRAKVGITPGITVAFQNVRTYFDTFLDAW